jgi:phage terminase small subunit
MVNGMKKIMIPNNLAEEAKAYIEDVLLMLEQSGIMEDVDEAAIQMLAYNYSTFIKASKIIEE